MMRAFSRGPCPAPRMWRGKLATSALVLVAALMVLLGGGAARAQAAEVLDQSQPNYVLNIGRTVGYGDPAAGLVSHGQTFQAGLSGQLTRVDVAL